MKSSLSQRFSVPLLSGAILYAVGSCAVAGTYEGTHVDAPKTDHRVTGSRPGFSGKTTYGNDQLKTALTASGAALASTTNPIAVAAGGVIAMSGKILPRDPYQDYATCAVSCATVPSNETVTSVNLHFHGDAGLEAQPAGIGVAAIPVDGLWDRGTGWWAVEHLATTPLKKQKSLVCVVFKNWSDTWNRRDVFEVVHTAPAAHKPSRPSPHAAL